MYEKRKRVEQMLALMLDLIVVFISLLAAYLIRYKQVFGIQSLFDQDWVVYIFVAAYVLVGFVHDWYRKMFMRGWIAELRNIVLQEMLYAGAIVVFVFMLHRSSDISRLLYGYFFVINTVLLWVMRLLFKGYMRKV